ncbi:MAG TPA: hypothetical protein VMN81_06390 [Vicinamibacterales bacterium]|nr:hypothetical protein [Vicinamibacterales bacterium]
MSVTLLVIAASAAIVQAQDRPQAPAVARIDVQPASLTLKVGEQAQLEAVARDAAGNIVQAPITFFSRARRSVSVTPEGLVQAAQPGTHTLVAMAGPAQAGRGAEPGAVQTEIIVTVPTPAITAITVAGPPRYFAGTIVPIAPSIVDETGAARDDVRVEWTSSQPGVAEMDAFGNLVLHTTGAATLTGRADGASATLEVRVDANPAQRLELSAPSLERVRTGDVVRFTAAATDAQGRAIDGLPVQFAVRGQPSKDIIAPGASAEIDRDGMFVAERSGIYTVFATSGPHTAARTFAVAPRDVRQDVDLVGHGAVRDRHTSDLWIWEGPDGHDYAITGTWGASGHAFFWDVTNPAAPEKIGEVQVDARTVNDVKISEDGRVAVISREGASNRRNGFVVIDISNPRQGLPILSRYDDELTGGVHNVFVHKQHVYAVNNGRRFDIVSIEDPKNPARVGRFELESPGHSIHDVWVVDGVAFSSNWSDGVVAIDVGGGGKGGSPSSPVMLGQYKYPSGWNHAAFPYRSKSTGKFYVFAGDESFPSGLNTAAGGPAIRAAGWIHVIEWDDWANPREVARYQVPEAGTHNLWVEDDTMYVGYYNGGLRVVDVSGELRGDLYRQGREIARFYSDDPQGVIANSPMVWGPQPYKGHVFFSDFNSGLWIVKLKPASPRRSGESQ